jgi:hypothetical protein
MSSRGEADDEVSGTGRTVKSRESLANMLVAVAKYLEAMPSVSRCQEQRGVKIIISIWWAAL